MAEQDKKRGVTWWSGTKGWFDYLKKSGKLVEHRIYFVGNSGAMPFGFGDSTDGVIYLATGPFTAVRFGAFSKEDDIDEKLEEMEREIEGKAGIEEHEERAQFPEVGDPNTFYVSLTDGRMYRWDGSQYVVFGGYTAGDGVTIQGGVISVKVPGVTMEDVVNQIEEFAEAQIETLTANEVWSIWNSIEGNIDM